MTAAPGFSVTPWSALFSRRFRKLQVHFGLHFASLLIGPLDSLLFDFK